MTVRVSKIPKDPYLGYDAEHITRLAAACFQCRPPAPCTQSCPRKTDIPQAMQWAGHAACEGLSISRCLWDQEQIRAARSTDAITDSFL